MRMAFLAILLLSACGGAATLTGSGSCSVTLSGAVTGSYTCTTPGIGYDSSKNQWAFGTSVSGTSTTPAVSVAIAFPGNVSSGTFTNTTSGTSGGASVEKVQSSPITWLSSAGTSTPQGTYSLDLTDTGIAVSGQGGTAHVNAHGSFSATLPAVAGSGASGDVTLQISF